MRREQFVVVQALRGLAALWVVLFHLEKMHALTGLTDVLPGCATAALFTYGNAGVAVFFVLSGFVIAHSLQGKAMTPAELGRFAVRRSIRLDPPYWASMVLTVAVGAVLARVHGQPAPLPGLRTVAAHLLYLQELLGLPEIQIVYWTLTYEIQFYLVFASAALLSQRWQWALYALALAAALAGGHLAMKGLFANLWHGFFLGVLAYRAGHLRQPAWPLLLLAAVAVTFRPVHGEAFAVPCAVTALLLFGLARSGRLTSALGGAAWQGLGAISYSLYLVHVPTLMLLLGAWQRLAGRGTLPDTLGGVVLVTACLVSATLFYLAVERPSHILAKRLFRPRAEAASVQTAVAG